MLSLYRLLALAGGALGTIYYAGVSESGGEFGVYSATKTKGTGLPGRFGGDYQFITESTVNTYVTQNGINLFRVAFLLERMCPVATGLGSTFNETHYGFYADAINYITGLGAYALLDPHNYMRYNDPSQQPLTGSIIGDTSDPAAATTAQFAAFWGELAGRFKNNPNVIFGLMNEPHDMSTQLILQNNQAAINAIRAAGAKQLILAPGNGYTGGHSWNQSTCATCDPSSQWLYQLKDPANNTAIDIHEYLDTDFSGSHQACVQPGPSNLAGVTSWLKQHGLKAMVTEFGGDNGTSTNCPQYLTDLINYMAQNPEYIGWAAWAAGPFWGTYSPCCTDSQQYGSLEPGSTAAGGGPSLYTTVWQPTVQPLVPKTLQKSGISSLNGGAGAGSGSGGGSGSGSSSSSTKVSTSTKTTLSTSPSASPTGSSGTVPKYGQCGGIGYKGPTACASGSTCHFQNDYYSQCY